MTAQNTLRRGGRRRANGEGSVTHRKDGLWMARVSLPDGTRATSYAPTYAAAQEKVRNMVARIDAGAPARETEQNMSAFMERWLEAKQTRAPKTYEEYRRQNRLYINPALGAMKLRQVTPAAVGRLIATLAKDRPSTAQHVLTTLRNAFSLAVDWQLISSNPAARVEKPKHRPKPVAPMAFEEAQAVLVAFVGHRLEAYITFMLDTGTRPNEALALRWENVDFPRSLVRIVASLPMGGARVAIATKTVRSNRTITLMEPTLALLERRQAEQRNAGMVTPWVFDRGDGEAADERVVYRQVQQHLRKCGLPPVSLYALRHGSATMGMENGESLEDIADRLGHTTIVTTADRYLHVSERRQRELTDRREARLFGPRLHQ